MSDAKQTAIAILPKFTAFFSILGSGFIIYDILCRHFNIRPDWFKTIQSNDEQSATNSSGGFSRSRGTLESVRGRSSRRFGAPKTLKNYAYYRLMLSLSVSDFLASVAWFMTTWPIPKDENSLDNPSEIVFGNVGTMQTCTAQAFFIQLGIITPFYNALLSSYYYLTIKREWKEEEFKRRIEYAGHVLAIGFGFGTSIAGLVMELYNNSKVWCWIAPYPLVCGGEGQPECVRGINSKVLRWVFYYGPLWLCIFLVAFFMTLVYVYVRGLDNKMNEYTQTYRVGARRASEQFSREQFSGGVSTNFSLGRNNSSQNVGRQSSQNIGRGMSRKSFITSIRGMNADEANLQRTQRKTERSRAVANQGLFYAGTFALVWVFGTITRAMQLANAKPPWAIVFLFAIFTPSQGFFNFLVYVRPRVIKYLQKKRKMREGRIVSSSKPGSSMGSDVLQNVEVPTTRLSSRISQLSTPMIKNDRSEDMELDDPFQKSEKPEEARSDDRSCEMRTIKTKLGSDTSDDQDLETSDRSNEEKKDEDPPMNEEAASISDASKGEK